MTEVKDIVFEEYCYNEFCDETGIYFEAPKSYLNGKHPEADGCTFLLHYVGIEWNINNATVWISPFEDDEDTRRSCYDWRKYSCNPEFKQALYDIFENRGKENLE